MKKPKRIIKGHHWKCSSESSDFHISHGLRTYELDHHQRWQTGFSYISGVQVFVIPQKASSWHGTDWNSHVMMVDISKVMRRVCLKRLAVQKKLSLNEITKTNRSSIIIGSVSRQNPQCTADFHISYRLRPMNWVITSGG